MYKFGSFPVYPACIASGLYYIFSMRVSIMQTRGKGRDRGRRRMAFESLELQRMRATPSQSLAF